MIRNYNDPISFREHGQPPDPQGRPSRPLPAGFQGRPGVRLRLGHGRPQRLLGQVVQGRKGVLPVKKLLQQNLILELMLILSIFQICALRKASNCDLCALGDQG